MPSKNPRYVFQYEAKVVRVIDADTLELDIDLGFRVHTVIEGRINGIDAPEMSTPEGVAARQAVIDLLRLTKTVTVASVRDRRTFARWVVDVEVDDLMLATWLIAHGFVKTIPRIEDLSDMEPQHDHWWHHYDQ